MSDKLVNDWQAAKSATNKAKRWQNLPLGNRYQNDTFSISVAHCQPPKLVRAGQQCCGGQNYWETEKEFNAAILEYLVSNWSEIYPSVISMMETKERQALIACQSYIDDLQKLIGDAVNS